MHIMAVPAWFSNKYNTARVEDATKKVKFKNGIKNIFGTSFNPLEIPPISFVWSCDYDFLRRVAPFLFWDYTSKKVGCHSW